MRPGPGGPPAEGDFPDEFRRGSPPRVSRAFDPTDPANAGRERAPEPRRFGLGRVWWEAMALAAAALPVLLLMDAYVRDSPEPKNDELIYELMAQAPFEPHTFPFAHRIAVPTLVHVLPFSHDFSFAWLAWLSTVGCGALVYVLLRRFAIGRRLAFALGLCIAWCPTLFVVSLREGRNVDPETGLVMLAGAIAIVDRRRAALAVILVAGALVREAALFLVPFAYAVWARRLWDPRALRDTAAAAAPALVAYAIVRLTVPFVERENVLGYRSLLGGRWEVLREAWETKTTVVRRVVLAFGPLWAVAPFALADLRWARRGLVLLAMCGVGMLFALDWGRIVFYALPVVIVAAAWVLDRRPRLAIATVALFLALNFVYVIYMEDFGGAQDGIIDAGPARYEVR